MKKMATIRESRRGYLRRTRLYVVVPPESASGRAGFDLAGKDEVSYRDACGIGKPACRECDSFIGPRRCKVVEGAIDPGGWCVTHSAS